MRVLLALCLASWAAAAQSVATTIEDAVVDRTSLGDGESVDLSSLEDPEFEAGNSGSAAQLSNVTSDLEQGREFSNATLELDEGRQLAEETKPKRKYCNTSAYGLKGDYAYEACGAFCKAAKAVNHCKFCKCRSCAFCKSVEVKTTSKLASKPAKKSAAGSAVPPLEKMKKKGKGKGKGKGGLGLKRKKKMN